GDGGVDGGDAKKEKEEESDLPKPIFRSYKPVTEELGANVLPTAEPANVEEVVRETIESAKGTILEDLDFMNLAPRKPDWDLKRDIAKKLEKLEKRTSRAIGEIIRERLKGVDLADAVAAGASHAAASQEDD
ncbi:coiled-coil domain-containing protein 12-like, partial [Eurytemora carolleeae]|uniref:coiled-coil domain-containing protein 12-like n=1 Tax=Eurytemora carolleeae TaxID=1294199 RepID=UPI000C75AC7F